jgi:hypothetical protein
VLGKTTELGLGVATCAGGRNGATLAATGGAGRVGLTGERIKRRMNPR